MPERCKFPIQVDGLTFNRWTVLSTKRIRGERTMCFCRCLCGVEKWVNRGNLVRSVSKSCGCQSVENTIKRCQKAPGESGLNTVYCRYKDEAAKRGFKFCLTKDEFFKITQQNCHYCGVAPKQVRTMSTKHASYTHNGIDRVDNEHGYVFENCVPCCKFCNRAKSSSSLEEFLLWINQLVRFNNAKTISS